MGVPRFLPYGRQCVDDDDIAAVAAVLRSDWLTTGPATEAFERAFAARVDAADAVSCANGTAALHLAMLALGLGPGDVAIVPAVTFVASANCARFVGAEVVFADVDPDTGLMQPHHLEEALARATAAGRPRVVLPVHLAGQPVDMPAVAALARSHGLAVVEDACHAVGTVAGPADAAVPVGACRHSDMAVFSLHPVKTITAGEGGAITTNHPEIAASLRSLRGHGITREAAKFVQPELAFDERVANPWYYEMSELGFNYRLSDVNCALASSQLAKLDRFLARREALAALYDRRLAELAPRVLPMARVAEARPCLHLYLARIDFEGAGTTRRRVMESLRERGVGSQVHYLPVHMQPYYRRRYGSLDLPGARDYYRRTLSLPLYPGMEDGDVDRVAAALGEILGGR